MPLPCRCFSGGATSTQLRLRACLRTLRTGRVQVKPRETAADDSMRLLRLEVLVQELQVDVPVGRDGTVAAGVHVVSERVTDQLAGFRHHV